MPLASTTTCPALVAAVLRAGVDAGAPDWVPAAEVAGAGVLGAGLLGAGLLGEAVAEPVVVLAGGADDVEVPLPPAQPERTAARAKTDRVAPKCFVMVGSLAGCRPSRGPAS